MLLEVKKLKTEFRVKGGRIKAVDGVDFEVDKGEIVAIVGESGSGKSVTSLSVMGLLQDTTAKISQGEILFQGEDLLKKSKKDMMNIRGNRISMIFQEPMTSLNPVYTIGNQVVEAILRHEKVSKKEALKKAIEMLKLVGISSPEIRVKDYPHQMSGGMRQRVMIAMALSCSPQLLIADEPTTALDVTIQAQILDLMLRLKERLGTAILLITHDLGVVAEVAERVVVMYCGKVVEKAEAKDIFNNPLHPYTQGLLKSIPKMDGKKDRLYMIKGMVPNPLNMPKGCAFSDRCEKCMSICREKTPEIIRQGNAMVRCFLYTERQEI